MYHEIHVAKLSDTQKSKLRNGHPVRIKIGSGNKLHLTQEQLKKLHSNHEKGMAYTISMHEEQAQKHGAGFFGDIATKAKQLIHKHRDILEPGIHGIKKSAHKGISALAKYAHDKVEGKGTKRKYTKKHTTKKKGTGLIGDLLKGLVNVTGVGIKHRKKRTTKRGKGLLSNLAKSAAKAALPGLIDKASELAKSKISDLGTKTRKKRAHKSKSRRGGALFPAGY